MRRRRALAGRRGGGGAALAALSLLLGAAAGQAAREPAAYPIERFHHGVERESILDVESGRVPDHLEFDLGLSLNYGYGALSLFRRTEQGLVPAGSLVGHRVGGSVSAAVSLFSWVYLGFELPFTAFQSRIGIPADSGFGTLETTGVGSLRVFPKVRILRQEQLGVDLALIANLSLPTAYPLNAYMGEKFAAFAPQLALSRTGRWYRFGTNLGFTVRSMTQYTNVIIGQELNGKIGGGVRFHPLGVPVNLDAALGVDLPVYPFPSLDRQIPGELLAGISYDAPFGFQPFVGAGVGVLPAPRVPLFRVLGGVRFAPRFADADDDGVGDGKDACADEPEDRDGYQDADGCPDPDNDQDGVPDADDECPAEKGPDANQGCPAETEEPAADEEPPAEEPEAEEPAAAEEPASEEPAAEKPVTEEPAAEEPAAEEPAAEEPAAEEPAAEEPVTEEPVTEEPAAEEPAAEQPAAEEPAAEEPAAEEPAAEEPPEPTTCPDGSPIPQQGCVDADEDEIYDHVDRCPEVAGVPSQQGCPAQIEVTKEKLEIEDRVFFKLGKAELEKKSRPLLDAVAETILEHDELKKVRIEGHTDKTGPESVNQRLSEKRAKAVFDYLVDKGVEPERLDHRGYGSTRPLAEGSSVEARRKNRRVEFTIVEQD